MKFIKLIDYIKEYHGTQKKFSEFIGRSPQHVNQMTKQVYPAYVVIDDTGIKIVTINLELTHEDAIERKVESLTK